MCPNNITSTTTATTTTTTKTTVKKNNFFNKIGSWFNRNSNKIGQSLSILGDTAMNVGGSFAQYQLAKDMMSSPSIWTMGMYGGMGMYGSMGMYGGYDMSSWYMNGDPLGVTGWMGGGYNNFNPYLTQMGNESAYNYGALMAQQLMAQNQANMAQYNQYYNQQTNRLPEMNYADETLDVANQNTDVGNGFDSDTNNLVDASGNPVSNGKVDLGVEQGGTAEDVKTNYKNKIFEYAKSYFTSIDSNQGDGFISLDEFIKHETSKLPDNATDAQKAEAKRRAEIAFKKLDMNNSGKLDWREYAAAIMTYDQTYGSASTSYDGVIKSTDYQRWTAEMSNERSSIFDMNIRKNFKSLFEDR